MELGLHPGIIFALAIALFLALHLGLRWPLPLAFLVVAVVTALLGDFGIPFRHLVEGGFGFINLVLALFAGAFFGHMMRASGAADAAAAGLVHRARGRVLPVLALAGAPLFVVGMFVGLSGVAVLSAGVFAVPALRRLGYDDATIAAFIAVMATAGMIAPPMNVPAILIASGVNMPWTNVARPLLALSVPLALAALGDGVRPGAVVNVGGALVGLGSCRESYELAPGLSKRPLPCTTGTPGLAMRLSADGVPLLHVLNMRRLAVELGLPFDPVPLPTPGNNRAIYGSAPSNPR